MAVRDPILPSTSDDAFRALFESRQRIDGERQLFANVVSGFQTGIYVYELEDPEDPAGMRVVYANPAAQVAMGVSSDAVVGRTLREAFPSVVGTDRPAIYAEVALGGAARSLDDFVYTDARIEETVFSVRVFPLPGRRVGLAFDDVTSARKADAQALETLESMSDAFYTLDHDWRFTYLNPQSEPILLRKREELLGRSVWDEFPEAVTASFYTEYHRAVRDHVAVEFEVDYPPLGGWFKVRAHPTSSGLSVYYQDVTSRRELESQLLQAQKLEAVGQLAGGVAHDFNNLLTVIDGYTALAQSKVEDPAFVQKALGEIAGASVRAAALTTKLLAFSRKQMLKSTVADANEIVSSALDLVEPLIGEQIQVHRLLEPDAGNVLVDIGQLEQVIVNLAVNGRDSMRDGGNLYIATRCVELDASTELDEGTYFCLTVRDDGCGMDAETQTKIFDPFFTTKPAGEGTGLGLSTAYGTITQSGGQLSVISAPGVGTTFTIYLPHSDSQVSSLPPTVTASQPLGGGERILVVEDEDMVRRLIVEILESFGYEVVQARNPQEALALCTSATFDLMVTDVVMPGGDGSSLARAAVTHQPNMRVLYTSGYTPQSIAHLDLEGSRTAFLPKPFSACELAQHVRGLLDL
jgi:signal transduction histidine kinase